MLIVDDFKFILCAGQGGELFNYWQLDWLAIMNVNEYNQQEEGHIKTGSARLYKYFKNYKFSLISNYFCIY